MSNCATNATPASIVGSAYASRKLGISIDTLHRRIEAGEVEPAGKLPGKTGAYIFNKAAIDALAKVTSK